MYSYNPAELEEKVDFFKECLKENGLESAKVTHRTKPDNSFDEFYVQKKISQDQKFSYKTALNFGYLNKGEGEDVIEKKIATEAKKIVETFKKELSKQFKWGEQWVAVSIYDGGWARCANCNTCVDSDHQQSHQLITDGCELSDPMPVQRDMPRTLDNMSEYQKTLFEMYLIGQLREHCNTTCQNNKHNYHPTESFK